MFPKLIISLLIIVLAFSVIKKIKARFSSSKGSITGRKVIQCKYCGTYVPEEECVKKGSGFFCSQSHAAAEES